MYDENKKTLVSWIGGNDLKITRKSQNESALDTLLGTKKFKQVFAIFTSDNYIAVQKIIKILEEKHKDIKIFTFSSEKVSADPTDYINILDETTRVIEILKNKHKVNSPALNITSGTPAMSTVMGIIGFHKGLDIYMARKEKDAKRSKSELVEKINNSIHELLQETKNWSKNTILPAQNKRKEEILHAKIAPQNINILLTGESGSGKSHKAREIHTLSGAPKDSFIEISCAELSEDETMASSQLFGHKKGAFTGADSDHKGFFEKANNGTLFLDEIGDLSPSIQSFLLRALQEVENDKGIYSLQIRPLKGEYKEVKTRVITATNKDLISEIQKGNFRSDLYYRLAEYPYHLAPLREWSYEDRKELINELISSIKKELSSNKLGDVKLSNYAMNAIIEHNWPGNIRQLRYVLKLLIILANSDEINSAMVRDILKTPVPETIEESYVNNNKNAPSFKLPEIDNNFSINSAVDDFRKAYCDFALEQTKRKNKAAKLLGISPQTLNNYLNK